MSGGAGSGLPQGEPKWVKWLKWTALAAPIAPLVWYGLAAILQPHLSPYLDLPAKIDRNSADSEKRLRRIEEQLHAIADPDFIIFNGSPILSSIDGRRVNLVYSLRRIASCPTDVSIAFMDLDQGGRRLKFQTIDATRAPVTDEFLGFSIPIRVPEGMSPGLYSYHPKLTPKDCGVYRKPVKPPPSPPFRVCPDGSLAREFEACPWTGEITRPRSR